MNDTVTLRQEDFRNLMGRVSALQTAVDRMTAAFSSFDPDVHRTLLTTEEAAVMLGFKSCAAFRKQRRENPGKFPDPIKVGGVLRYRVCDIDSWIMAQVPVPATG